MWVGSFVLLDRYFSNYHFLLSPFFPQMYHWVIYYKWPSSSSFFSSFSLVFSSVFYRFWENDRFAPSSRWGQRSYDRCPTIRRGWADGYISHGPSTRFVHDFPPYFFHPKSSINSLICPICLIWPYLLFSSKLSHSITYYWSDISKIDPLVRIEISHSILTIGHKPWGD